MSSSIKFGWTMVIVLTAVYFGMAYADDQMAAQMAANDTKLVQYEADTKTAA